MLRLRILLLSLLVLPSFSAGSGQAFSSAAKQIDALRSDWCRYLHAKQLEPEMALYAADAVFLQPTGERVTGLAAIRSLFVQVMGAVTSEPTLTSVDLDVSGDLAYDSGTYSETLTSVATGAKTSAKGSYLMVLKRGGDGQWRIQQQMWSQSP